MKRHLVENDINKMKSLIDYNIGETISEQEEKYGNCSGSNSIEPPIIGEIKLGKNKEGKPTNIIRQICELVDGPISAEVIALIGAHVATIPFNVIEQLSKHPLTDMGIKNFLADWEKVKNR